MYVAKRAAQRFWVWVQDRNLQTDRTEGYLHDCLDAWLTEGDGIEEVGGSYTTFLETVVMAIQLYMDDQSRFGERRLTGVYHEEALASRCFERDYFEKIASLPPGSRRLL